MADTKDEAKAPATVTTATSTGEEFETEVGVDGKNPVSPNNPPAKAVSKEHAEYLIEQNAKVEERQAKLQEAGSDGPGNDHNKDGLATEADLINSTRPVTSADPSTPSPSAKDQDADNKDPQTAAADAPAKSASKSEWVKYAVDEKGADKAYAESKTRDELAEEFGK